MCSTSFNIPVNKRNFVTFNISCMKKSDRNQTSSTFIQHGQIRYNKVVTQFKLFCTGQSCMLFNETFNSSDWAFSSNRLLSVCGLNFDLKL